MSKITNPFKLIISVPIIFIILTALFVTWIHITDADSKFENDYKRLTSVLLKEERLRANTILESFNSYINLKKNSSNNILKDKIKSRVLFADKIFNKLYNNNIGILSTDKIIKRFLFSLNQIKSEKSGEYVIYEKSKLNKNKIIFDFLNINNEGFISLNKDEIVYIKKIEDTDFIIGYKESLDFYLKSIKKDVLNKLNLINFNGTVYTLDKNLNIIQHSQDKTLIQNNVTAYENNKNVLNLFQVFLNEEKNINISKHYWEKLENNNYKILSFTYIKDWDWIIVIDSKLNNFEEQIMSIIGIKQAQRNETINNSIKASFIFILIASIISYFISDYINKVIKMYKNNIEKQKDVLKYLNNSLEVKVGEKTKQLQVLNNRLSEKFKLEVRKNRQKDQLLNYQAKFAIMGEMIGNIVHQWRQPLSTISTLASGNKIKIDYEIFDKKEIKKDFEIILDTTQYLSHTIDDFRNFFLEEKTIEKFDLITIIERNLNLVSSSFKNHNIKIVKNYNTVEIKSIKNELLQAVLNIFNNAKDALNIEKTSNKLIIIDIYENENKAFIEIKDSAGGISSNIIDKIFNQYFTTKRESNGTGIGLYMTRQIIENSLKGKISVKNEEFIYENKPYIGACFKISLPLHI